MQRQVKFTLFRALICMSGILKMPFINREFHMYKTCDECDLEQCFIVFNFVHEHVYTFVEGQQKSY